MYDLLREVTNLSAPTRGIPQEQIFENFPNLILLEDSEDNENGDEEDLEFAWLDDVDFPEYKMFISDFNPNESLNDTDYGLFNLINEFFEEHGISVDDSFWDCVTVRDIMCWDIDLFDSNMFVISIDNEGLREKLIEFHD